MSARRGSLRLLATLVAAGAFACGDSGSDSVSARSAPLAVLEEIPIVGLLLSECTSRGASEVDSEVALLGSATAGLLELPPLASIVGSDLGELLLVLELHADELPVVSVLAPSLEDPSLLVPLPFETGFRMISPGSVPLQTPVLGNTSLGCGDEASPLGLVPILARRPG